MSKVRNSGHHGKDQSAGVDLREQLFNDGLTGPAGMIQLPTERITRLLAFMYDFDPKLLIPENPFFPPANEPRRFYEGIKAVLDRHPLARHAKILCSGTGLHAIVQLQPPLELGSAADQQKWATLIRAAQCSLPADPNASGITSLTRAVGSINSKNGAHVEVLKPGVPIEPRVVEEFVQQLVKAPFRTVAMVLLGDDRVLPCPVCRGGRSRLDVLDQFGKCYARCGKVALSQIFDCVFKPLEPAQDTDLRRTPKPVPARHHSKEPKGSVRKAKSAKR